MEDKLAPLETLLTVEVIDEHTQIPFKIDMQAERGDTHNQNLDFISDIAVAAGELAFYHPDHGSILIASEDQEISDATYHGYTALDLTVQGRVGNLDVIRNLWKRGHIDGLTGAYTRGSMDMVVQRLEAEAAREKRAENKVDTYTIMVDMDNFKQINDTHGHLAGDTVLKAAAKVMMRTIRSTDYLVRFGGDEFAIVFNSSNPEILATRLYKMLNDAEVIIFNKNGNQTTLPISVSMGIADKDSGLKGADTAMYASKSTKGTQREIGFTEKGNTRFISRS